MLQAILNKILQEQSANKYLEALAHKHIAITVTDFKTHTIYASFEDCKILLSSSTPEHIDIHISGRVEDFVSFALFKTRASLQISGDASIATDLEKLYNNMHIDWEDVLAQFSGDTLAYPVMHLFNKLKNHVQESGKACGEMVTEYLRDETNMLPSSYELQEFMHAVDLLRLQVDRLEARINAYASN